MKFSKEELDIIKEAIKEYEYLERNINHEIKEGASMEQLLDYVSNNFDIDITNCDLKSDYKYIDFNYGNINCSIISSNETPTTFSKSLEVWNDKGLYIISEFVTIDELKDIVKEGKL